MKKLKKLSFLFIVLLIFSGSFLGGAISEYLSNRTKSKPDEVNQKILNEESAVIKAAEIAGPSVVTVGATKTSRAQNLFDFDPFSFFQVPNQSKPTEIKQDVGSGFIVSKEGLIITNKHVVSDAQATYRIITKDDVEHEVKKIYRDPVNDLAILKIDPKSGEELKPIELGDSNNLKVGQFVIAIGTALGEFRHTVTTGVISGLGRGISAGSPFEGYIEKLDNVIQTDAAINPGNSGGPLLNSSGQAIGINVAVAASGQNIGFAIPISVVKDSIANFEKTGKFERPFLGVRYRAISQNAALLNEVPQGAYIVEVVDGSPADKAGIKPGDIITEFDGQSLKEDKNDLSKLIEGKKAGEKVKVNYWRQNQEKEAEVTLGSTG